MKKKLLSLLLALCLVMALVPMTAFAEGTSVDNGTARQTRAGIRVRLTLRNIIFQRQNSLQVWHSW